MVGDVDDEGCAAGWEMWTTKVALLGGKEAALRSGTTAALLGGRGGRRRLRCQAGKGCAAG